MLSQFISFIGRKLRMYFSLFNVDIVHKFQETIPLLGRFSTKSRSTCNRDNCAIHVYLSTIYSS